MFGRRWRTAPPSPWPRSYPVRQGLAELRELAHRIHPAVLSERGLAAALAGLVARSPLPVELRVSPERAAPTAEAAIYFSVAEALTNITKHARATRASVAVGATDGAFVAEIVDEGVGGARPMRERKPRSGPERRPLRRLGGRQGLGGPGQGRSNG